MHASREASESILAKEVGDGHRHRRPSHSPVSGELAMTKSLFRNDGAAAALQLHDQTEATDGDRRRQWEGWPARTGDATS
jgi:hypothetical protein